MDTRWNDYASIDGLDRPSSLHELSPYLGKMRPELAAWAIDACTKPGDRVYDPFCGSGTVLLEAQSRGRIATGSDLNPYAILLSRAKLNASKNSLPSSGSEFIEKYALRVDGKKSTTLTANVSQELKSMYHPDTLVSLLAWVRILQDAGDDFGLACLMGIAHHQRPGFLSYPASHTVPYLRNKSFPVESYPELYEYRDVESRLQRKVDRALSRLPDFANVIENGTVKFGNSGELSGECTFDAIITSPPYMGQLHYGRDNRIRLELLGFPDWQSLDSDVSPRLNVFLQRSVDWLSAWSRLLKPGGTLSVLVGDKTNTTRRPFAELVANLVLDSGTVYKETGISVSPIPSRRRVRKGCEGSSAELLLQFEIVK
nr:DNA methyltransferase [Rhodococcus sp. 06-1059B-a]